MRKLLCGGGRGRSFWGGGITAGTARSTTTATSTTRTSGAARTTASARTSRAATVAILARRAGTGTGGRDDFALGVDLAVCQGDPLQLDATVGGTHFIVG